VLLAGSLKVMLVRGSGMERHYIPPFNRFFKKIVINVFVAASWKFNILYRCPGLLDKYDAEVKAAEVRKAIIHQSLFQKWAG
jgi:hypothetical protein